MKRTKNFYLFTLQKIKEGKNLSQISKDLDISIQSLNYYVSTLKENGCIKKVGYGAWEFIKDLEVKELKKSTGVGTNQLQQLKKIKEVRGHAFQIRLELPDNYRNWLDRRRIFNLIDLKYKPHYIGGLERGEIAIIDNIKVHFYHKSIVFNFDERDFISETAQKSKSYLLVAFLRIVKKLERTFNNSPLSHYGKYKFKVTRQHYALMKNALASQYINEEKKLHVYSGRGLWLLIDNSFNLEELETVHPETAEEDNEKIQAHFNLIKATNLETIKEMSPENLKTELVNLKGVFPAMEEYNKNLKLHISVEQETLRTLQLINKKLEGGK